MGKRKYSDRHIKLLNAILDAILVIVLSSRFFGSTTCEKLSILSLPETTIMMADSVAPGKFAWPHDYIGWKGCLFQPCPLPDEPEDAFKNLPAFCRVAATLKPSSDSDIKIEIWMPISGWNAKFMAVGNGGWAGTISYADMGVALLRGYAVASTNTGHDGTSYDAGFGSGHAEKLIDFGYRAVHEMTATAKAIVAAYYGNAPQHSYWNGCSTGGRQALMEAQRFPTDFDKAARKIYSPVTNPRTKQQVFPPLEPGSELGWAAKAGPQPSSIAITFWRDVVFKDAKWDYRTFDFDSDLALGDRIENGNVNAVNPDLKSFFGHGGKLLQYHGWSDPMISPQNSINYYKSVLEMFGGTSKVSDFYRLFMVPGMAHCGNGEGADQFDPITVVEEWVEKGKVPDQIIASRSREGNTEQTRPLCPYPKMATYKGTGSTNDAANFSCSLPK